MRYYKQMKDGILIAIGTGPGGIEITQDEYNALMAEIRAKAELVDKLVDKLYAGEITPADIPTEWQEEVQRRADMRQETEATDHV